MGAVRGETIPDGRTNPEATVGRHQYAVGHGWITPLFRVIAGVGIGAALMYYGRRMEAAADDAVSPVALRELMIGAALAAWYISAYAAAVSYHLISISSARLIFLALSIAGGLIALNERRALLALMAVGTGFLTPFILAVPSGSIPASALFLAVLSALSLYLYLMRGWQSVLWLAFVTLGLSVSWTATTQVMSSWHAERISLVLLTIAAAVGYTQVPIMRRKLVAANAARYTEPIRSPSRVTG